MERKFDLDYDSPLWSFFITPASVLSFTLTILCSHVFAPLLYSALLPGAGNIKPNKRMFSYTLLASTLHSLVTISLAAYIFYYGVLGPTRVYSSAALGFIAIHISFGYAIGDFIVCLFDPFLRRDFATFAHHLFVITGLAPILYLRGELMYFPILQVISEASTPFVNLRFIVYETGKKDSFLYTFASLGMMVSFFLCRMVRMPWHWYALYATVFSVDGANLNVFIRVWVLLNFAGFDVLNVYWFSKMVKGAARLAKKHSAAAK